MEKGECAREEEREENEGRWKGQTQGKKDGQSISKQEGGNKNTERG